MSLFVQENLNIFRKKHPLCLQSVNMFTGILGNPIIEFLTVELETHINVEGNLVSREDLLHFQQDGRS